MGNVISKVMYMFVSYKDVRKLLLNIFLVLSGHSREVADSSLANVRPGEGSFFQLISPLALPGKFQAYS